MGTIDILWQSRIRDFGYVKTCALILYADPQFLRMDEIRNVDWLSHQATASVQDRVGDRFVTSRLRFENLSCVKCRRFETLSEVIPKLLRCTPVRNVELRN